MLHLLLELVFIGLLLTAFNMLVKIDASIKTIINVLVLAFVFFLLFNNWAMIESTIVHAH
jgi:hypothetical protein